MLAERTGIKVCTNYMGLLVQISKTGKSNLLEIRTPYLGRYSDWRKCSISQLGAGYKTVPLVTFCQVLCLIYAHSHICITLRRKFLNFANNYKNVCSALKETRKNVQMVGRDIMGSFNPSDHKFKQRFWTHWMPVPTQNSCVEISTPLLCYLEVGPLEGEEVRRVEPT